MDILRCIDTFNEEYCTRPRMNVDVARIERNELHGAYIHTWEEKSRHSKVGGGARACANEK